MRDWWKVIEEQLDAHSETAPDPWSELTSEPVALTDEQQQFLAALDDQPPITRSFERDARE